MSGFHSSPTTPAPSAQSRSTGQQGEHGAAIRVSIGRKHELCIAGFAPSNLKLEASSEWDVSGALWLHFIQAHACQGDGTRGVLPVKLALG